jgi:phosphodiesterase/alkaline phosphatase D-like protein
MWYGGSNEKRTIIAGEPMKTGVIEQRDKYLDIIVNKSTKVRAVLTGDEHNYCKTQISDDMPRYSEDWSLEKLKLKRSIYQINNGACGAPYYAQDKTTPWSEFTSGFSTQNALVLFDVDGNKIKVRVLNPDTLEEIESFDLD